MSTQHTATPYSVSDDTDILGADGEFVATTLAPSSGVGTTADYERAAFIVRACNNHDALLAALRELLSAAHAAWNKGWEHDTLARNRLAEQIHAASTVIARAEGR